MKINPASYDEWYKSPFGALCHRLERDALFSLAGFRPGEFVLDAGCGIGVYLEEMRRLRVRAVGLDEDEDMLAYASRTRGYGADLVRARLQELPFKPCSLDKVLSVCALEFLPDPLPALKELSGTLKDGGILLLGFLNIDSPWARLRMEKGKQAASVWRGVRFYSLAEVAGIASGAGLSLCGHRGAVYFPPEAEGKETHELFALEAGGSRAGGHPGFIATSFKRSGMPGI